MINNAKQQIKVIEDTSAPMLAARINALLNAMQFEPIDITYLTGVKVYESGEKRTLYIALIKYRDVPGNAAAMAKY